MKPNKLFKKTPLIATSLTDRDIPNLNSSLLLNVDLIELRVDMFDDISTAGIKNTFKVARKIKKPIIVTVRDLKEGGQKKINNRLDMYKTVISLSEICDIEINSDIFKDIKKLCLAHNKFLIGSYHNFKITPNDKFIEYIIRKGKRQGADIVKIAVMPQITKDVTRLFLLALKHSKEDIITISMGAKGKISRFINPIVGSMITYGYIYRKSAEGQPSVDDLRRAFNLLGFR